MRENHGIDDVQASVNTAATTTFPVYSQLNLQNNSTVTTVNGFNQMPRNGTAIPAGTVAWTAGTTIGNAGTMAPNKLYSWHWDGTKIWFQGPGFN